MKKIWKFRLDIANTQHVQMPVGAELLTVQLQHDELALWAKVDPAAELVEMRLIRIAGTGHPTPDGKYVGTVQMHNGNLVLHVFDGIEQ